MEKVREYKSSVFSMLMSYPEYALQVYNALNSTNYDNPEKVRIVELEKTITLSVRHDAAFVIDDNMNIYEHQSTINPNMPLRSLIYMVGALKEFLEEMDETTGKKRKMNLYSRRLIQIPNPHFVVFYNGIDKMDAYQEMKLSDAYVHKDVLPELELTCKIYNINDRDSELGKCEVISGYMFFVEKTRYYVSQGFVIRNAVKMAIDECIENNILRDFFESRRMEVLNVMALDYTWTELEKLNRLEALDEGRQLGIDEGRQLGLDEAERLAYKRCIEHGLSEDEARKISGYEGE